MFKLASAAIKAFVLQSLF